jgi:hypothetical protein
MRLFGGASIIAAAVSIFTADAAATPISLVPDATYYNAAHLTLPNSTQQFAGGATSTPVHLVGTSPYGDSLFSTSNNYAVPSVSATAQAAPGTEGTVSSYLTYYVSFVGAAGNISVHVNASGAADASGPNISNDFGHNEASAFVEIAQYFSNGGTGSRLLFGVANSNGVGSPLTGLQTFSIDQSLTLAANAVYQVVMHATAQAYDGHTSTASLDPFFTAPAGYTILTSAGIGNSSVATTPIPAALPLFATALGGMGLIGWRRRRTAGRAAAA